MRTYLFVKDGGGSTRLLADSCMDGVDQIHVGLASVGVEGEDLNVLAVLAEGVAVISCMQNTGHLLRLLADQTHGTC